MKINDPTISRAIVGAMFGLALVARASDPAATNSSPAAAQIDPIEANDPDFSARFGDLYEKTWGPGAIPEKYKQLTGISISVVERCETCLSWHLKQAVRVGATKAELIEAIRLGQLTGGSICIPTVRRAYEIVIELKVK